MKDEAIHERGDININRVRTVDVVNDHKDLRLRSGHVWSLPTVESEGAASELAQNERC